MKDTVVNNINFWVAIVLCGVTVAIGAAFCGWCVELLNTKGIGDGMTIIILAGIIHNIPHDLLMPYFEAYEFGIGWALLYMIMGILLAIGALILAILFNLGEKKLRIIFSKRTVGMKQYGMQNQVLPLSFPNPKSAVSMRYQTFTADSSSSRDTPSTTGTHWTGNTEEIWQQA